MKDDHGARVFERGLGGARIAITGCSRGIGVALLDAFAAKGARLVVHARGLDDAREAGERARRAGAGAVEVVAGNLLDEALAEAIAGTAEAAWGGLDALIMNAAVLGPKATLEETKPEELGFVLKVDVEAQLRLYQACVPRLRTAGGGLIVWMSSGLGRIGVERYGAYCAAKHALEGLMKVAHTETAGSGVVNVAMAPGMVQTAMLKAALEGGDTSAYQTPEATARGFVRFFEVAGAADGGRSLDISAFM